MFTSKMWREDNPCTHVMPKLQFVGSWVLHQNTVPLVLLCLVCSMETLIEALNLGF